jgi:chemotaxis signal transduction protein
MSAAVREAMDAASLRRAFDDSFARPPAAAAAQHHPLLAISAGAHDLAVRLSQVARVEPLRTCVPVPETPADLLGLAGSQDRLYAVFSLAALLGQPSDQAQPWMLLVAGDEPIALAFSRFEGLLPVEAGALAAAPAAGARHPLIPELVRVGAGMRGVLDLAAVLARLVGRARR